MRESGIEIGDRVDVKKDRARDMSELEFNRAEAAHVGQMPRAVDHAEIGVAEFGGQLTRRAENAGGHVRTLRRKRSHDARRLIFPFIFIRVIDGRPLSPVLATWVPSEDRKLTITSMTGASSKSPIAGSVHVDFRRRRAPSRGVNGTSVFSCARGWALPDRCRISRSSRPPGGPAGAARRRAL